MCPLTSSTPIVGVDKSLPQNENAEFTTNIEHWDVHLQAKVNIDQKLNIVDINIILVEVT